MKSLYLILLLSFMVGCTPKFHVVYPIGETEPVKSKDDAADDIAIFIHPDNPDKQAIIGTNKQSGLVVYDNQGKIIKEYPVGRINNVDLRQNVAWNNESITIVGGSNRSNNSIIFFRLDEEKLELKPLHQQPIVSKVDEVYGFCMYQNEQTYAFVVGKDGMVEQWQLTPDDQNELSATMVRNFAVGSQCEGMVADDALHFLYVGEEDTGIWRYNAQPTGGTERDKVVLINEHKSLKADIEGLSIYYMGATDGYLIASSQGNNSYAVFQRKVPNTYIGSFKIKGNQKIGGVSETDGIDVTSAPFGTASKGVFIAQDGNLRLLQMMQNKKTMN